jgi:hypothetical protein
LGGKGLNMDNTRINQRTIGEIVKDKKGNLYEIINFTNSLFMLLRDLKTNELVISNDEYYTL